MTIDFGAERPTARGRKTGSKKTVWPFEVLPTGKGHLLTPPIDRASKVTPGTPHFHAQSPGNIFYIFFSLKVGFGPRASTNPPSSPHLQHTLNTSVPAGLRTLRSDVGVLPGGGGGTQCWMEVMELNLHTHTLTHAPTDRDPEGARVKRHFSPFILGKTFAFFFLLFFQFFGNSSAAHAS